MADNEVLIAARLFQSGNPEVARRLSAIRTRSRSVSAGETIFEPGDAADSIFLLAGARAPGGSYAEPLVQVRLAAKLPGRGPRLARIVRGDVFGEVEFLSAGLDPKPGLRSTSARALTPARLIGIGWRDIAELLTLEPALGARLLRLGARRMLDALSAEHSQGHEDPDIVLADWLVEFAADLGVAASNRVSFPKKLSQSEIADELGVSRETVSRRLKEWERSGLVTSSAAGLEVIDYARLVRIAGLNAGRDRAALTRAVADVSAEIDAGDLIDARNAGADMLRYFPASPDLVHLLALAAARSGDREEAIAILKAANFSSEGGLEALRMRVSRALRNPFADPEQLGSDEFDDDADFDPGDDADGDDKRAPREVEALVADLAGLEARLLKDAAFAKSERGDAGLARESRRAYEAIWRRIGSWYAGINAAAMALVEGDRDAATTLSREVLARLPGSPDNYWAAATRAEALLISGERAKGIAALTLSSQASDAADSAKASTMLQLRRLGSHLDLDDESVSEGLGIKSVAVATGHMFRGSEMNPEAQAKAGEAVRAEAERIFVERRVGQLFGALACGSDIVLAEAAIDAGIPFHAVLPFPLVRFAELSVDVGDPKGAAGGWRKRFDAVVARAASLTLADDELPLDRDLDGHFFHGFRFMAGLALMRADVLQTECRLIAVTDGGAASNVAGANRAVADWQAAGRPVDEVRFPFKRKSPAERARGASSFRPVVLLWDIEHADADARAVKKASVAKNKAFTVLARSSRVGGEGTAIVAPSLAAAIELAERCAAEGDALRVICDFGLALGSDGNPDPKLIARLTAGSDMPGFPGGRPLATLAFAAQAVAEFGRQLEVSAVGRTEEARDGEGRSRRRSGLPVYQLALKRQPAA